MLRGVLLLALLTIAQARVPRASEVSPDQLRHRSESHEFFVLVKPPKNLENTMESTEELAKNFKQRLGQDKNIKISAVSKDKMYIHIKGDKKLAEEMIGAVRSFPEAQFVERKPEYRTRDRVGGRGTRRDRTGMKQRVPAGKEAPAATF